MSKLSLDALKERAGAVASEELLNTISGGTTNDCHPCSHQNADTSAPGDGMASSWLKLGNAIAHYFQCM